MPSPSSARLNALCAGGTCNCTGGAAPANDAANACSDVAVTLHARRVGVGTADATTWGAGALCLLPVALLQGAWPSDVHMAESTGWLVFLGVVPTLLAYRWYFSGPATVRSTTAAVLVLLETGHGPRCRLCFSASGSACRWCWDRPCY